MRLTFNIYIILHPIWVSALLQNRIQLFVFIHWTMLYGQCLRNSYTYDKRHVLAFCSCRLVVPYDSNRPNMLGIIYLQKKNMEKWERLSKYGKQKCMIPGFTGQRCLWSILKCYSVFFFILFIGRIMWTLLKTQIHINRFLSMMGGISAIKIPISTFVLAPYKREREEIREILYILSFPHKANFPPRAAVDYLTAIFALDLSTVGTSSVLVRPLNTLVQNLSDHMESHEVVQSCLPASEELLTASKLKGSYKHIPMTDCTHCNYWALVTCCNCPSVWLHKIFTQTTCKDLLS